MATAIAEAPGLDPIALAGRRSDEGLARPAQAATSDALLTGSEVDAVKYADDTENPRIKARMRRQPLWKLRSNVHFITVVVGYGVFVDLCIYGIASPVIPFRLEQLGYKNVSSLTGWLVAAYGAGLIVSSPPIGYLGERISNRQAPLLVSLLFMAGALVMFMLSKSFALLLVSRILQGVSGTGIFTLGLALLADCTPEENLGGVTGNAIIGMSIGGLAGPPIGGALYNKLGYYAPWIFSIIIVAVDFVLRLMILEPHQIKHKTSTGEQHSLTERGRSLKHADAGSGRMAGRHTVPKAKAFLMLCVNPRAATSLLISFCVGIYFGGALDSALTLRLNQRYGLNSLQAGLVFIANAVPSAVVGPIAGILADRHGPKWLSVIGIAAAVPVMALLCIDSLPLWAFCLVLGAVGFTASIPMPGLSADLATVARQTPGVGFSHVFSLFNMSFSIGAFIGPIIAGQVLESLGIERGWYAIIGITAGLYLLCIPAVLAQYPNKRRFLRERTKAEDPTTT